MKKLIIEELLNLIPETYNIREKALELDEKDFDLWFWELIYKNKNWKQLTKQEIIDTFDNANKLFNNGEYLTGEQYYHNTYILEDNEIEYEYEMFLRSEENEKTKIDGWINISYDKIKDKDKISEYIKNGILRIKNIDKTEIPIIYGCILNGTRFGYQAYAIDGNTGEIIDSHFCSSENFAKSDLGFTDPYMLKWNSFCDDEHSTVSFNKRRKEIYLEKFKNGYTMEWIGHYSNNEKVTKLLKLNNII